MLQALTPKLYLYTSGRSQGVLGDPGLKHNPFNKALTANKTGRLLFVKLLFWLPTFEYCAMFYYNHIVPFSMQIPRPKGH